LAAFIYLAVILPTEVLVDSTTTKIASNFDYFIFGIATVSVFLFENHLAGL
jgi:hypothetical protein